MKNILIANATNLKTLYILGYFSSVSHQGFAFPILKRTDAT